jgi:hypothetical protein
VSDQVQGAGYSEFKVETFMTTLELEMDTAPLELETEIDMSQEISKQLRYLTD